MEPKMIIDWENTPLAYLKDNLGLGYRLFIKTVLAENLYFSDEADKILQSEDEEKINKMVSEIHSIWISFPDADADTVTKVYLTNMATHSLSEIHSYIKQNDNDFIEGNEYMMPAREAEAEMV